MKIPTRRGCFKSDANAMAFGALVLFILCGFCSCDDRYNEGFEKGREKGRAEGFIEGKELGYAEGHRAGYDEGYATAVTMSMGNARPPLRSIDGTIFESKASSFAFWLFAALNFVTLIGAVCYLIIRQEAPVAIVAKILIAILASYVWFRIFEPWILGASATNLSVGGAPKILIELAALAFGIIICLIFDELYIKRKKADVWIEAVGVASCSLIVLSLAILVINHKALFAESDLKVVFHGTTAMAMGGLAYTAYALISRFMESKRET